MKYFTKFAMFLIVFCGILLFVVEPGSQEQTLLIYAMGFNFLIIVLSLFIYKKD